MLNVSFDFDEATHKISNLKVTNKEEILKQELEIVGDYDLKVLDGKLQLTSEAVKKLGVVTKDRIAINYWYAGPSNAYPIISKADVFDEGVDGNQLTKNKTISFRGEQRDTLLKYGSAFKFETWVDKSGKVKEGVFKLIPIKEDESLSDGQSITELEVAVDKMSQKELEDDAEWLMEL